MDETDDTVAALARLFAEHPAWCQAARRIARASVSNVYFSHRPREAWHLERLEVGSALEAGKVSDPDFVFRFSPGAVKRLCDVRGGVGEFAHELFARIEAEDPQQRVDLRVAAPFARLTRHGFLRLLLEVTPKVAAYALRQRIFSVSDLRRFVQKARETPPYDWEIPD